MISTVNVSELVARENLVCGACGQDLAAVGDMGIYDFDTVGADSDTVLNRERNKVAHNFVLELNSDAKLMIWKGRKMIFID